jgi:hypothetical protein
MEENKKKNISLSEWLKKRGISFSDVRDGDVEKTMREFEEYKESLEKTPYLIPDEPIDDIKNESGASSNLNSDIQSKQSIIELSFNFIKSNFSFEFKVDLKIDFLTIHLISKDHREEIHLDIAEEKKNAKTQTERSIISAHIFLWAIISKFLDIKFKIASKIDVIFKSSRH